MKAASFLVRVTREASGGITRCHIRHTASGREVYLQSGANLQTFVRDCLLSDDSSPASPDSEAQG